MSVKMVVDADAVQVLVRLNGETVQTTVSRAMDEADTLRQKHGGGFPEFLNLDGTPFQMPLGVEEEPKSASDLPKASPNGFVPAMRAATESEDGRGSQISAAGKARSEKDRAAAEAAGFRTAETVYARGTKVVGIGVQNAHTSRRKWEQLPTTETEARRIRDIVRAEDRQQEGQDLYALRMTQDGRLGVPYGTVGSAEYTQSLEAAMSVSEAAFSSLVTRLGFGGATYLRDACDPPLRAYNWNAQLQKINQAHDLKVADLELRRASNLTDEKIPSHPTVVLGTRFVDPGKSNAREIFRAVSTKYTPFDLDQIAEAFAVAMEGMGGRGRAVYDGNKARLEAIFHTNVAPEDYVAGEFFKFGLVVRTDDVGGGSIQGNAVSWQNLCLNLMVIDRASQPLFRLRHMGDFNELVRKFQEGIKLGEKKIGHFLKAWGFAVHDNVIEEAQKVDTHIPLTVSEALGGFFRGIIDRELVPVKGKTEENVRHLVRMYEEDDSKATKQGFLTRAAIINAFTRYAHSVNSDPWQEHEIEQSVANLLYGRREGQKPSPLPWLPEPKAEKSAAQAG